MTKSLVYTRADGGLTHVTPCPRPGETEQQTLARVILDIPEQYRESAVEVEAADMAALPGEHFNSFGLENGEVVVSASRAQGFEVPDPGPLTRPFTFQERGLIGRRVLATGVLALVGRVLCRRGGVGAAWAGDMVAGDATTVDSGLTLTLSASGVLTLEAMAWWDVSISLDLLEK